VWVLKMLTDNARGGGEKILTAASEFCRLRRGSYRRTRVTPRPLGATWRRAGDVLRTRLVGRVAASHFDVALEYA